MKTIRFISAFLFFILFLLSVVLFIAMSDNVGWDYSDLADYQESDFMITLVSIVVLLLISGYLFDPFIKWYFNNKSSSIASGGTKSNGWFRYVIAPIIVGIVTSLFGYFVFGNPSAGGIAGGGASLVTLAVNASRS